MCPSGSGDIQTPVQAGGMASPPMRSSVSASVTSLPDGSRYRKPSPTLARLMPGPCGSLRTSPATAAADTSRLITTQRIRRPSDQKGCVSPGNMGKWRTFSVASSSPSVPADRPVDQFADQLSPGSSGADGVVGGEGEVLLRFEKRTGCCYRWDRHADLGS